MNKQFYFGITVAVLSISIITIAGMAQDVSACTWKLANVHVMKQMAPEKIPRCVKSDERPPQLYGLYVFEKKTCVDVGDNMGIWFVSIRGHRAEMEQLTLKGHLYCVDFVIPHPTTAKIVDVVYNTLYAKITPDGNILWTAVEPPSKPWIVFTTVLYDRTPPSVAKIFYVADNVCVDLRDDTGIRNVKIDEKKLNRWPGNPHVWCSDFMPDDLFNLQVVDYGQNRLVKQFSYDDVL